MLFFTNQSIPWKEISQEKPDLHVPIEVWQDDKILNDVDLTTHDGELKLRTVSSPWNIYLQDIKPDAKWRYIVKNVSFIQKIKKNAKKLIKP